MDKPEAKERTLFDVIDLRGTQHDEELCSDDGNSQEMCVRVPVAVVDWATREIECLRTERDAVVRAATEFADYLDQQNIGLYHGHKLRGEVLKAIGATT